MRILKLLVLALPLLIQTAKADLLLEPYMGLSLSGEIDNNGTTSDVSPAGAGLGARVGYQTLGLMLGLDYTKFTGTAEYSSGDVDYSGTELAAFVGYNLPILLRVWVGFALSGKNDYDTGTDYEGLSGTKFGIGFTGLPLVSINLEHKVYSFDETAAGATATNYDYSQTMLSVSLPLTF